jgi:hypothetical protein
MVKPDWTGRTCVVMASGPGLTDGQAYAVSQARDRVTTIAVNSSYMMAYWADIVYAGDLQWWKSYHKKVPKFCQKAQLWTGDHQAASHYQLNRMKSVNRPGLGLQYTHMGGNSGYQAINLAFLFGSRRILLLGFTMREIDGRKHWHVDHPQPLVQKILPDEWRHKFQALAKDLQRENCQVINCDPLSALTCFPMGDIEEELKK